MTAKLAAMDSASLIAIIGGTVGLVGGITGILSWLNQRKQTEAMEGQLAVMREQLHTSRQQEVTATDWARKFDESVEAIAKVSAVNLTIEAGKIVEAYSYVFESQDLRRRIETYLGRRRAWLHKFTPAVPGRDQLQNPTVQQTIRDVLNTVAQFKRDHTDFARTLKLL